MTVHQRRRLVMLVLAAALVVPAIAASNASAILKRLPNGQVVSYMALRTAKPAGPIAFDSVFTNMDYNGGPIMPSNTDYMLMWSPEGLGAYPPGSCLGIARYFEDLAHDSGGSQNVDSVSTRSTTT